LRADTDAGIGDLGATLAVLVEEVDALKTAGAGAAPTPGGMEVRMTALSASLAQMGQRYVDLTAEIAAQDARIDQLIDLNRVLGTVLQTQPADTRP
ncbi:MAG: hypothetical protein AAF281_17050, partial [Pseudomonadota bacterium]